MVTSVVTIVRPFVPSATSPSELAGGGAWACTWVSLGASKRVLVLVFISWYDTSSDWIQYTTRPYPFFAQIVPCLSL